LFRESCEILLPTLKSRSFLARRALKIHSKPKYGDEQACHSGRYVLTDLKSFLASEVLDPSVVALYFRHDRRAVHVSVLRLHNCDWLRCTSGARSQEAGTRNDAQ
jgi:hypothetical protein